MIGLPLTLGSGDDLMSHVMPHELFRIGGFSVTNHIVMTVTAAVLLCLVFIYVASRTMVKGTDIESHMTKGRLAQVFEVICQFIRNDLARPALGNLTDKYIGYIWTTFFFILFCNLLGMIPIGPAARLLSGSSAAAHWGGTATANISITAGLALIAFFMIHFVGIREQGLRYFLHFAPLPFKPWPLIPIALLLVVLELIGSLVKPFALCVRLFANMVAGHLVIAAMLGLIFTAATASAAMGYGVAVAAVLGSTAISLLELFVAFLQAYIFTFLTVLFIAAGAVHEHEESGHEAHGPTEPA
jgi:F-type H+-transporting ATPase subunit a